MTPKNGVGARLRGQRGSIAVIAALSFPVLLLLAAMVIDVGNWYTHKRSLQNRADAGALAAGYQYLSALKSCATDSTDGGPGSTALTTAAKQYAGAASGDYNAANVNDQDKISVGINSDNTDPFVDFSDRANPCEPHPDADAYSPEDSLWTDVKVREKDIGTLAGGFGLNLSSITAQARVAVNQAEGVARGGLPFVNETGDQVECVWARFVDAGTGTLTDAKLLGGTTNPVILNRDQNDPRHWTAPVGGIDFRSDHDIAVQYWLGSKKAGSCKYDPTQPGELTAMSPNVPINHIRVYNDDHAKQNEAPELHNVALSSGSCGGPGFVYTASLLPTTTCMISFNAEVDSGDPASPNPMPDSITVSSSNPSVSSVTVNASPSDPGHYAGQLTFNPNEVDNSTGHSQSYTEVGLQNLTVSWKQTSGKVGGKSCKVNNPCTGTFKSGACGSGCDETVAHATYVADPVNSNPLMSAELTHGAGSPIQNSYSYDPAQLVDVAGFTIDLRTYGIDQQHAMLIREWNGPSGNRSFAIDCGQGNGNNALRNAVVNGCPDPVGVNVRNDVCSPQPDPATNYRDCVRAIPGDRASLAQGYMDRFSCSAQNHWIAGSSPANLSESDPRFAYIFLTSWGQIVNAKQNQTMFPIRAFLRVYVTGWTRQGGGPPGPETCGGNEKPPEPYNDQGNRAQLWGHFVDVITLSDDVITGDEPCDLTVSLLTCKPQLVR